MEDYWALKTAAKLGNVEMMTQIYCLVADDGQRASMQNNSELFKSIFKIASLYSQLNVMKTLMKWCASSPFSLQQSLLENEDFVCFHNASEQGRIDSLQSLYDWATEKNRPLMLSSRNFRVFNLAARCGHTIAFKQLSNWLDPKALSSMLSTQNYQIFSTASEFGHAEILDYIYYRCAASDGDRLKLVQSNDYLAFKVAAVNGHLSCITLLFAWIQDKAALLKSWEKHMSTTLTAELRESVEIKRILLFLKTSSMIKASGKISKQPRKIKGKTFVTNLINLLY